MSDAVPCDRRKRRVVAVRTNITHKRFEACMTDTASSDDQWLAKTFRPQSIAAMNDGHVLMHKVWCENEAFYWTIYTFLVCDEPDMQSLWVKVLEKFTFLLCKLDVTRRPRMFTRVRFSTDELTVDQRREVLANIISKSMVLEECRPTELGTLHVLVLAVECATERVHSIVRWCAFNRAMVTWVKRP